MAAASISEKRAIIIDTDAGIDDAQALMVALRSPLVRILAITCSHGNVSLANVEGNVCAVVAAAGVEVPIYIGCDRPMLGTRDEDASEWHGKDGLGNTHFGAKAPRTLIRTDMTGSSAIAALAISYLEATGQCIDIVTLGPLTTLALALRQQPRLSDAVGRIFVMGGAYTARGNTSMVAEYNILQDPEAAAIVLQEFPAVVLTSWELTLKYQLPKPFVEHEYLNGSTPRSRWLSQVSRHLITASGQSYVDSGLAIPDPLCMMIALRPEIVTKSIKKPVFVELGGKYTRGMTVVDWMGVSKRPSSVEIVEEVDFDIVKKMLLESVASSDLP